MAFNFFDSFLKFVGLRAQARAAGATAAEANKAAGAAVVLEEVQKKADEQAKK
jgi:hypothetical protein